jgi:hypothetical protein
LFDSTDTIYTATVALAATISRLLQGLEEPEFPAGIFDPELLEFF